MRLKSFTAVAIRLMGLMSIFYGVLMLIYILVTYTILSEGRMSYMGSVIMTQLLLPGTLIVFGFIFIGISRLLGDVISRGLED
jgi:hypothetical protein